jgi:aldehyde dehydrogenase (NAD(P)+)
MSEAAVSQIQSESSELDAAVTTVKENAAAWAGLAPLKKAELLEDSMRRLERVAPAWVAEGCRAKGLSVTESGEIWMSGPLPTMRVMRLLRESVRAIASHGRPPLGTGTHSGPGGRLCVDLLPASVFDRITFLGFSGFAVLLPGLDVHEARSRQAAFAQGHDGGQVCFVAGGGNAECIPPTDVLTKLYNEGSTCILKMNPVNAWVGAFLEQVFEPFVRRGFLRIVYGGADAGQYLCGHPEVDRIHITGSDRTHDSIVWGPAGDERVKRKRANTPVIRKPITSELGNVSPVALVPADYSQEQLWFMARNVVSMVTHNASFNCNAAKVLITAKHWAQRGEFLTLVRRAFAQAPTRLAYYPGARERYERLTAHREGVERLGEATAGTLAWAWIPDVDAANEDEVLFREEPFCGILTETALEEREPAPFIRTAVQFMNDRLWGTLNAMFLVHPRVESGEPGRALEQAILDLRYGTVAINHWPAVAYGVGTMPWGGHPSSTKQDIQSGLGWVHNTFMIEGIEKSVIRGPLVVKPTPAWFPYNRRARAVAERMFDLEANPSVLKLPALVAAAVL